MFGDVFSRCQSNCQVFKSLKTTEVSIESKVVKFHALNIIERKYMYFKHTNLYKCRFTNTSITGWENLLKQENPFLFFSKCKDGNRNLQKIYFDNLNKHCRVLILLSSHPVFTVFLIATSFVTMMSRKKKLATTFVVKYDSLQHMYVQQFCGSLYSLSFPNTYGVKWHISIKKKGILFYSFFFTLFLP